jgi:hypothetical protein
MPVSRVVSGSGLLRCRLPPSCLASVAAGHPMAWRGAAPLRLGEAAVFRGVGLLGLFARRALAPSAARNLRRLRLGPPPRTNTPTTAARPHTHHRCPGGVACAVVLGRVMVAWLCALCALCVSCPRPVTVTGARGRQPASLCHCPRANHPKLATGPNTERRPTWPPRGGKGRGAAVQPWAGYGQPAPRRARRTRPPWATNGTDGR